ncbi:ATP-dependent DNA helicase [Abeliophyllum distichum]|uniref:ATP-dependent DNA helicase n=1 Tax=Abeliophyllum distichum TaxID=126358 RepID=A0ABD1UK53_9LAMI
MLQLLICKSCASPRTLCVSGVSGDESTLFIENQYQNMGEDYKFITAITPNTTTWTTKVVVLEKTSVRTAYHSPTKYQNVVLMDMERNRVQATIYDTNIQAFQDHLIPSRTYLISNAVVRLTKP